MRIAKSLTLSTIAVICGCSSFSATINPAAIINDAGTDGGATGGNGNTAGASATGGGAATGGFAVGGVTSSGGISTAGGAASTGGISTAGGISSTGGTATGGASSTAGTSSTGGKSSTAGASSTGGSSAIAGANNTGGATACAKDADCVNPDPVNCSYTCVNPGSSGVCKPAALLTPTQCATSACDDKAISGFWDAQGKPHIAFGYTETDGTASIRMQQLNLDGSLDGAAVAYKLPAQQQEAYWLSADVQADKVALLWTGNQIFATTAALEEVEFGFTDLTGTSTTPTVLDSTPANLQVSFLSLQVTPTGAWLALEFTTPGSAGEWEAATGSSIAALTGISPPFDGQIAAGVLGNTLMLTGASCAGVSGCQRSFALQRYSVGNLSAIGGQIDLSQNFQANEYPAMGPVNGQMSLLWTEAQSPGQLFRTLIKEDGTFAHYVDTVQSAISPRAIVESLTGGSLLVGVIASGTPTYQLVAQRLDSSLGLIGNPLPIAAPQNVDVSNIELHSSADGSQALITYRQAGARYRILGTSLCASL